MDAGDMKRGGGCDRQRGCGNRGSEDSVLHHKCQTHLEKESQQALEDWLGRQRHFLDSTALESCEGGRSWRGYPTVLRHLLREPGLLQMHFWGSGREQHRITLEFLGMANVKCLGSFHRSHRQQDEQITNREAQLERGLTTVAQTQCPAQTLIGQ